MKQLFSQVAKFWFAALALTLVMLSASSAFAGIIITDGRGHTEELQEKPGSDLEKRPLTEAEQELYIAAALFFAGHDAAVEQAASSEEDSSAATHDSAPTSLGGTGYVEWDADATSCSAASPSLLACIFGALAFVRLRGRRSTK